MSYIGRGIDQIDNISTLDNLTFNGSDATFNLTQNSVAFVPVSADALQIQIDGVIQSGNYTVSGSTVTFDFTPSGSSVCNGIRHYGVGLLTQPSDGSVNMAQLGASGTKDATTFLRGDNTFATAGTTINNNADNRVITGSGTANTLEGEANLTFDGTDLDIGASAKISSNGAIANFSNHNGSATETALATSDGNEKVRCFNDGKITFESAGTEKMRIENDGQVLINTTSDLGNTQGVLHVKGKVNNNIARFGAGTNGEGVIFVNPSNTQVGYIQINSSSTVFGTSSDYRLKENAVAISDGITRLKTLKPYRFNFIADNDADGNPTETVDGFFAHEVTAVPEAISGTKDAMAVETTYTDDDVETQGDSPSKNVGDPKTYSTTEINPQGIDQSKLVPLLTSALQEAITKIETLEARVQTLENA